jgi:hypothetical protein
MHVSSLLAATACILQVKHVVISEGTRSARPSLSLIKIAQRERRSTANGMPSCRTVALDVLDARFVCTFRSTTPGRSDFVRRSIAIRPIPFALDSPGHTLNRSLYDDSADQNETEMKSFDEAISAPPSAAKAPLSVRLARARTPLRYGQIWVRSGDLRQFGAQLRLLLGRVRSCKSAPGNFSAFRPWNSARTCSCPQYLQASVAANGSSYFGRSTIRLRPGVHSLAVYRESLRPRHFYGPRAMVEVRDRVGSKLGVLSLALKRSAGSHR